MKVKIFVIASLISISSIFSQNLKSPSEFLGYKLETKFTRHYKVVQYFE